MYVEDRRKRNKENRSSVAFHDGISIKSFEDDFSDVSDSNAHLAPDKSLPEKTISQYSLITPFTYPPTRQSRYY